MKLFCFGFGQVAQSFVDHLLNFNVDLRLTTTSRKNTSELTFKNLNYFNYEFNENDFDKDLTQSITRVRSYFDIRSPNKWEGYVYRKISKK